MEQLLEALKDNQHLVLMGAAVWFYVKWRAQEKSVLADAEAERVKQRALIEEVIKSAMNNGIGSRMREIVREALNDHEKVEQNSIQHAISAFRNENIDAHKAIGQRQSDLEQRAAILESKWASVLGPKLQRGE